MLRKLRKRIKGQSTVEYAVLIMIIIGALIAIQQYVKRGIQGRMRSATDDIGEQFSPGNTNIYMSVQTSSRTNEVYIDGAYNTTLLGDEVTNMTSSANIINMQWEYWGNSEL